MSPREREDIEATAAVNRTPNEAAQQRRDGRTVGRSKLNTQLGQLGCPTPTEPRAGSECFMHAVPEHDAISAREIGSASRESNVSHALRLRSALATRTHSRDAVVG